MPRTEKTKQARLNRTLSLLKSKPDGLSEIEIADQLGINRRTINNYLRDLEIQGQAYRDEGYWFPAPIRPMRLRPIDLEPEEAATLYLAARLFVKQTDKRIEPAEGALYKLADALMSDIGVGKEIRQAAQELANRPGHTAYSQVFSTVVQGYLYRRVVRLTYQPRGGRPFETTFSPYLLEPSAIGYTTYVIGYSSAPDALRTYKIERILHAALSDEEYHIPYDFPGLDILRHSWSIMLGEDLINVVLRFHPQVVGRVRETRWHPTEQTEFDPDKPDWLRWSAQVADTTDMLPWIRGWGADVEVLEPQDLRDRLTGEARRIAERYGWHTSVNRAHSDDDLSQDFADFFGE